MNKINEEGRILEFGQLEGDDESTGNCPNSNAKNVGSSASPEVSIKKRRRRFSKAYKLSILKEIDSATKRGQVGAILRREGLYSSHIQKWREQRDNGKLYPKKADKNQKKLAQLMKENRRLQKELNKSKIIIDAQKKIFQLLDQEN